MPTSLKPPTSPPGRVSEAEYATYVDDWFADMPTELVWPLNIQTYAAMRRDASVVANLAGWTLQVRRAQWQLDDAGVDPAMVQLVADDLGLPVMGNDRPGAARTRGVSWPDHLRVALNQALAFGHSGYALGADVTSGQARLTTLAERPPWTITEIHVDPVTGDFLGVTQSGIRRGNAPEIPAAKMAWYVLDREGANWAGVSALRGSWLPWLIKREMIRVNATSNRRWGAGVPVMEALPGTNPTPGEMTEAQRMASAARAGDQAGAASPPGFQMKILGLSGSVPDTLGFIEWCDRQVARSMLMGHLELGQGGNGGSRALGSAFVDSLMLALETLAEAVADTATRQVAARIVEWNDGDQAPVPKVTVSGIGSRREVTAESLQLLMSSGALQADPALEAWIRREYRLPERDGMPQPAPSVRGDSVRDANVAASRRRRPQADGQLSLPIAAAAGHDPQQVADELDTATASFASKVWPALAAPMVAGLVADVAAAPSVGALAALTAGAGAVAALASGLGSTMLDLARRASRRARGEVQALGVDTPEGAPDVARLTGEAEVTAAVIAQTLAGSAQRTALLHRGDGQADEVRRALDDLTDLKPGSWLLQNLASAMASAQAEGRMSAFRAAEGRVALMAVEANDGPSRCDACDNIDGKVFRSFADAAAAYPAGRHVRCVYPANCHGHLRPVVRA